MHNITNTELVNIYPYAKFYQIPFIQSWDIEPIRNSHMSQGP